MSTTVVAAASAPSKRPPFSSAINELIGGGDRPTFGAAEIKRRPIGTIPI